MYKGNSCVNMSFIEAIHFSKQLFFKGNNSYLNNLHDNRIFIKTILFKGNNFGRDNLDLKEQFLLRQLICHHGSLIIIIDVNTIKANMFYPLQLIYEHNLC